MEIKKLTKKYGKKSVVNEVNLSLDCKTYALLGPNGAGKTTLIRMLAGVLKPTSGSISQDLKKRSIGYVPQRFGCFPDITVYEQLQYFCFLKNIPAKEEKEQINSALELVHLADKKEIRCKKLSGGMIRRVGIAQALLGSPRLLLLDEPTVGLDLEERLRFNQVITALQGKSTIIISTHQTEDIRDICSQVIIMDKGRILINSDQKDVIRYAQGKVYFMPASKKIQSEHCFVMKAETNGAESFMRVLSDSEPVGGILQKATLEDGYFAYIKRF